MSGIFCIMVFGLQRGVFADLYYFDLMCGKHVSMIRLGSDKS